MLPLPPLGLLLLSGLLDFHTVCGDGPPGSVVPRKTVSYNDGSITLFRVDGVWNYSSMLLREDLGLLLLGAREAVYGLDLRNISRKTAEVQWAVTQDKQAECTDKGKTLMDCWNYILILHVLKDGRMYVCGTNAFSPTCGYMTYEGGQLLLLNTTEDGKGICPYDPYQRYSSLIVDGAIYSATAMNFLGSEMALQRKFNKILKTHNILLLFYEPQFVSMVEVPESVGSVEGDDDKVYLFFSEIAVEYDFSSKLAVSRVARVCKGDMGGQRILHNKWTSFLKARLDCPVLEPSLPFLVQDVFLWRDSDWRNSVFYAVFTPQSASVDLSAVCAYSVTAVGDVFSKGKFKTPVTVETSHTKWVMYSGELPVPRPGACIDNTAKQMGIMTTLDLPDKVLQFVQTQPLMDPAVEPLSGRPLLVKRGAAFTRIVVDRVTALDGQNYTVMFVGTDNGFVQKAVNYDGEMVIIEEMQLFHQPVPIEILRLSVATGQLYAGSSHGAAQVSLSVCGRYRSCLDCVLARDPYCAWSLAEGRCTALPHLQSLQTRNLIQSVKDADASTCPIPEPVEPENMPFGVGNSVKLPCQRRSNNAVVHWLRDNQPLKLSSGDYISENSLLILRTSAATAGRYECRSVESTKGRRYTTTLAIYQLSVVKDFLAVALQVLVVALAAALAILLGWNLYHGYLRMPCC
ncbi:semaphorin-4E-like [Scleropages formosus]|uniref:semaphorin-4E-like n=1 Tax=Scleropages formosus TaxID=113540 RepID=UPI0010FAA238|nr:semaphorin-4E-like [Scleropages formosus]XP_029105248.1 semaphorin-4E-like [Scleropages formosus]